jgi:hypothetical protein
LKTLRQCHDPTVSLNATLALDKICPSVMSNSPAMCPQADTHLTSRAAQANSSAMSRLSLFEDLDGPEVQIKILISTEFAMGISVFNCSWHDAADKELAVRQK